MGILISLSWGLYSFIKDVYLNVILDLCFRIVILISNSSFRENLTELLGLLYGRDYRQTSNFYSSKAAGK